MRLRTAQQLQADVYALLDEASSGALGVKPAPLDLLECLNQQWCDVYAELIKAGICWNMQVSRFQTTNAKDTYGFADGAWWGNVASLALTAPGTGYTSAPAVAITGAGGAGATAVATIAGGLVTGLTLLTPGQGYPAAVTVAFTGGGGTGATATATATGAYWKTMGVGVQGANGRFRPAHRFQFEQRYAYPLDTLSWPHEMLYDAWGGTSDASGLDGTVLKFATAPSGAFTIEHDWFPNPQRMVLPTDAIDGIAGADRAMVFGAAQEMAIMLEQEELADRWAQLRSQKMAAMISVLRDRNSGEAPMARVVRGLPTRDMRRSRIGWGDR